MIGREEEKKYLLSLLTENEPQFVAIYGRRRIGKTYLIRETFEHNFVFSHTGLSNNDIDPKLRLKKQLEKFGESLKEYGYIIKQEINSWNDAFNSLKDLIKKSRKKKKVIFIDELSWMDTKNSGLISALESFWNSFASNRVEKDVVLIVCASATYWIVENIVNSKGGLHNRLTGQIHLKPFTLLECEEYLKERKIIFNRHQIIECYMILGGVPYYWSLLKKGKSLAQNINDLFFVDGCSLENEFDNLYSALFGNPNQYIEIVEALSSVNRGISREEICTKTGIKTCGDLTKKLKELEKCGFIRKYIPFGYKEKNSLYQLIDNYTLFYYKFLKDNLYNENYWTDLVNSPRVHSWSGIAFEKVCLEHIPQIKKALGISGVYTEINSWECKKDEENGIFGSQIDLLIVRRDQIINMCEMKYSETDYIVTSDYVREQNKKVSDLINKTKTKYSVHPTLITTYNVKDNAYKYEIQSIILMDDLFQ